MSSSETTTSEPPASAAAGVDISPAQDGGILKEVKREGSGEDGPLPGDTVIVHYVGTLEDGSKFDSSRDRGDKFEFKIGKGNKKKKNLSFPLYVSHC